MKYKIFLLIFVLSLISSIILAVNSTTGLCAPGNGCDVVNSSVYGSTLGIKNSIYGVFIFTFLILLTLFHIDKPNKHTRKIIHSAVIVGSIIAAYFLLLQIFVIKAICKFCLVIDIGLIVGLGLMIYFWDH